MLNNLSMLSSIVIILTDGVVSVKVPPVRVELTARYLKDSLVDRYHTEAGPAFWFLYKTTGNLADKTALTSRNFDDTPQVT